jgi:hypothetical protein
MVIFCEAGAIQMTLDHLEQCGFDKAGQPQIVMPREMLAGCAQLRRHGLAGNPKSCQFGKHLLRRRY